MIQTLLKIGLCGLTFYLFINSLKSSYASILFSTAYALMGYNIIYHHNIMWLDGVILLPLVIWGIHKLFEEKSANLYIFSLSTAIITNYYIGYMICIFSVLYFCYYSLSNNKKTVSFRKLTIRFIFSSLLSGGLSAFLLIPVFKSLEGGKASFNLDFFTLERNFPWSDLLTKIFIGSFDYEQAKYGLPVIFCGIVSMLFLSVYFLSVKISLRKKLSALLLLLILFGSFYFQGPNLLWHGMNPPAWFPYRYSFIFTFFILLLSYKGWHISCSLQIKERIIVSAATGLVLYGLLAWTVHKNLSFMSNTKYLINSIVIAAALLFFLFLGSRFKKTFYILLGLLLVTELGINGRLCMSEYTYKQNDEYSAFVEASQPAVDRVKELDNTFYRMEKLFSRKENDPMLLGYKGLSHYSSSEKDFVKAFMGKTGFRNNGNWAYYNRGSTFAMDTLLGVKYVLSYEPIGTAYTLLDTVGDVQIYRNDYALPIGFMVDEAALNYSLDEWQKFELQNHIWQSISSQHKTETLFTALDIQDVELHNLSLEITDIGTNYIKMNQEDKAYIEYYVTAKDNNPVFAFFTTNEEVLKKVKVSVNGDSRGDYFSVYQYDIIRLGEYKANDTLKIRLTLKEDSVYVNDAWIYTQNMDILQAYYQELNQESFQVDSFSSSQITGSVQSYGSKSYIMFTIPYEDDWNAWIDGEKTETLDSMGTFLTVPVPDGYHEITLKYIPSGRKFGILISVFSLIIFILSSIFENVFKKNSILNHL